MRKDIIIYAIGYGLAYFCLPLRLFLAFAFSTTMVLVLMPSFIGLLKKVSIQQTESEYVIEKKTGTPIMGGLLFTLVGVLGTILFAKDRSSVVLWALVLSVIGFGAVGFFDDMSIVLKKNNAGLKARTRLALEAMLALGILVLLMNHQVSRISFSSSLGWMLAYGFLVLFMFMGSANAVNLCDGMDGLAAGISMIAYVAFLTFALVKEVAIVDVFCASMAGGLFGYLRYNHKPAKVFMGDTGSLALGGSLACLALVNQSELALIFIAGVPVLETLSVIIQIGSVKLFHRRVFPYTPIHYTFKLLGMKEVHVVYLFWVSEFLLALMGLYFLIH